MLGEACVKPLDVARCDPRAGGRARAAGMLPCDLGKWVLPLDISGFSSSSSPSLWGVLAPLSFIAPYPTTHTLPDLNLKNKMFLGQR